MPANVNSIVPRNSATSAYMTFALPKLPSGDCNKPGIAFVQGLHRPARCTAVTGCLAGVPWTTKARCGAVNRIMAALIA